MPAILFPAFVLLIIGLLLRKWLSLMLLLAAMVSFVWLYGTALTSQTPNLLIQGHDINVLTYNVQRGNKDYERIELILRNQQPDVVALQEVTADLRDYVQNNLSDLYPVQLESSTIRTRHGQMLLSRWPVVDSTPSVVLRAVFDIEGTQFVAYSLHLTNPLSDDGLDSAWRTAQADSIRQIAADETLPLIMMGDYNMTDATDEYREFTKQFIDVFRRAERGFGLTFPNWRYNYPQLSFLPPLIRLDYMFVKGVEPLEAGVIQDGTSDHYPLWAELRIPQQ
jgi:vancomycin resistance protein VanJ